MSHPHYLPAIADTIAKFITSPDQPYSADSFLTKPRTKYIDIAISAFGVYSFALIQLDEGGGPLAHALGLFYEQKVLVKALFEFDSEVWVAYTRGTILPRDYQPNIKELDEMDRFKKMIERGRI